MNHDNNIEPKQDKVLDEVYQQFRCQHCNSVSQPIAQTHFECPSDYRFLDIYVCVWCGTGFVFTERADGFVDRNELSQDLVRSWDICEY